MTIREVTQTDWCIPCDVCGHHCFAVIMTTIKDGACTDWLLLPVGWISNAADLCSSSGQRTLQLCCPKCIASIDRTPERPSTRV